MGKLFPPADLKIMMNNFTVSVIIAFFNGSKWIERAIVSVLNQSVSPYEFFIVNDGSSDIERDFLFSLSHKYNFKILDKENGGQSSARNFGVINSKSDYICFLDQDDYFLYDHIEILLSNVPAKSQNIGFIYGDCKEADSSGKLISDTIVHKNSTHPKKDIKDYLKRDMFILPSASLISRTAYLSVDGFDEQFRGYEDDDLFLRMYRNGFEVIFVNSPVFVWCINNESTSYSIHMSRSRFKFFKKIAFEYTDREDRNLYFMRDYFIPRFEPSFCNDILKYKKTEHRKEILKIFDEYINLISSNKNVFFSQKLKARLFRFIIPIIPMSMYRYVRYIGMLIFR